MDAFDALLAQPAKPSKSATPPAPADPFEALLAQPTATSPSKPRAQEPRAQEPRVQEPSGFRDFVTGAADLADLVVAGIPAAVLGTVGEGLSRVSNVGSGKSRRQIAEEGAAVSGKIGQTFGTPIRTTLQNLGYITPDNKSTLGRAVEGFSSWLERDAASVEERSGGKILKQDYMMFVNGLMAAAGVKGVEVTGKAAVNSAKSRYIAKTLKEMDAQAKARAEAEAALPPSPEVQTTANLERLAAERQARDMIRTRQPSAEPRASLRTRELQAQVDAARVRGAGATGEVPPELSRALAESQLADLQRRRSARESILSGRPARPQAPRVEGPPRPFDETLNSALAKQGEGRLFDMTPEERIALRGFRRRFDARTNTALAVGATGLGLAALMEPDAEEAALAIGAGALIAGRGQGLTLKAIKTIPDATPLGRILDQSAHSLNTLEQLPKDRFQFSKQQVADLLKRQEVTKAERDILQGVLDATPGNTVTAKQLMQGVKERTGDFELKRREARDYADYGLDAIGRNTDPEPWIPENATPEEEAALRASSAANVREARTTIYQSPVELGSNNHFRDPNYFAHTRSFVEDGIKHVVELQSDFVQKAGKVLTPEERARLEKQKAFFDRISLLAEEAHSAVNDVTSTVDEIASAANRFIAGFDPDVQPNIKMFIGRRMWDRMSDSELYTKTAFYGEAQKLAESDNYEGIYDAAIKANSDAARMRRIDRSDLSKINSLLEEGLYQEVRRLNLRRREIATALEQSGPAERVQPMLKNWHKRLIREELAAAAREGQPTVRFASADTVAKVEGWPERNRPPSDPDLIDYGAQERVDAGTTRFSPEHQGIYDRYAGDVTKFLKQLGGKEITDVHGHTWIEVPVEGSAKVPAGGRVLQFGAADQRLINVLGASAGAAALTSWLTEDKEKKLGNALKAGALTAVLGLVALQKSTVPGVAQKAKSVLQGVEDFAGNMSYQIEKISKPVLRAVSNYKMGQLVRQQNYLQTITPWVEGLRRASERLGPRFDAAVLSGDWKNVTEAAIKAGSPELIRELAKVRTLLSQVGADLKTYGVVKGLVENYYPRIVSDLDGLMNYLGEPARDFVEQRLAEAVRKNGAPLSPVEQSIVLNKAFEDSIMRPQGTGNTFRQGRTIPQITEAMARFYVPASESLPTYLEWAANAIERNKFFGKNAVVDPKNGKVDIESSIGNVIAGERAKGKLSEEQKAELARLLSIEFNFANRAEGSVGSTWRNLTNMSLIANVGSAVMNFGDVGNSAALHGLLPTIKAIAQTAKRSDGRVKPSDLGLADVIAGELTHGERAPIIVNVPGYGGVRLSTAAALDKAMKYSGFKAIDSFGKQVLGNAALNRARILAKDPAKAAKFAKDNAEYFGQDIGQLMQDLRSGDTTPLTMEYVWRQLSDAQPLTSLELPTARTAMPNARFLWQLKSYMLKQLTLLRKNGIDKIRKGDVREGMEFLLRYGLIVGLAQASTDWIVNSLILGRDDELEWGDIPMSALKNFGLSRYALDKFEQGKTAEGIGAFVLPPTGVLLDLLEGNAESVQRVPLVGRIIYNQALGGAEKANEREARKRERELNLEERDEE